VLQSVLVDEGATVESGALLALIEVMKMETEVRAPGAGTVAAIGAGTGASVAAGDVLIVLAGASEAAASDDGDAEAAAGPVDPGVRADLAEVLDRRRRALDEGRPHAIAGRHERGGRTARENLDDLVDEGSFVEYGIFALAAQRRRRSEGELIERTAADGLIGGIARVNGELFGEAASCAVVSYDYTVLAGTQGAVGHFKKDRLFEVVERLRLPVVLFAEGGGGRPGDTDVPTGSSLTARAFALWGRLSGLVPRIAIVHGRCFAGNAALAGTADILIATEAANIGMGGPAMIEGGGLGTHAPEEIGPIDVQAANGVVDVRVDDEAAAVGAAKRVLAYFQGRSEAWTAPEQEALRHVVPESRRRSYSMRSVIEGLADAGSVTELRAGFGRGMITTLGRIEGRPLGILANDPSHMAGAITSDGSDKAARFMSLCEAFGLPLLSLVDTPGMMVGPEVEETALVRHCSRLFSIGPNMTVPLIAVVVGRGYGLGAQAMVGGSFLEPLLSLAWPTGELGPMGIEGAVRLGMKNELAAIDDEGERERRLAELAAGLQEHFRALNVATYFEIDDVIDPAETRARIGSVLAAAPVPTGREGKRLRWLDTW
jgi:acetyl-CoA carboxylase carboxyltransferase component